MSGTHEDHGTGTERHVRDVTARLGVADFVLIPINHAKGNATREIGDGLLVCGTDGAILQVKARRPDKVARDAPERAESWVRGNARDAIRQAQGSRRTLARSEATAPLVLTSARSLDAPPERRSEFQQVITSAVDGWPLIVVLDHPGCPPIELDTPADGFVVSLDDWRFLLRAIRSVAGLMEYIARVLAHRPGMDVAFGRERDRFNEMCEADEATNDGSPSWLPWLSDAALRDPDAADTYQHFIDRAWPAGVPLPGTEPKEYLRIVEFLDRVPPTVRVQIGASLRRYVAHTVDGGRASGSMLSHDKAFVFVVDHTAIDPRHFHARLTALTAVRSGEMAALGRPVPVLGVGVLTHEAGTDYQFCLLPEPDALGPVPTQIRDEIHDEFGDLIRIV
jgi:hypothetical protein